MQTVACDIRGNMINAPRAKRGVTYYCLECRQPVRRRNGLVRRPHFYHLSQDSICNRPQRSLLHRQIQDFIQQQFPGERLELELRFPLIGRIADIAWPARRLIFEIQCSPISPFEMRARRRDYAKAGYQIVWILLADRFYRRRLTEAEKSLLFSPYFFISKDLRCFVDHTSIHQLRRGSLKDRRPVSFQEFSVEQVTRSKEARPLFRPSLLRHLYFQLLLTQTSR